MVWSFPEFCSSFTNNAVLLLLRLYISIFGMLYSGALALLLPCHFTIVKLFF